MFLKLFLLLSILIISLIHPVMAQNFQELYDLDSCQNGIIGNLNISINDPEPNEKFNPGEEIGLEVGVENTANFRLDVIMEGSLYNLNKNNTLKKLKTKSRRIKKNNDEDFELELKVPTKEERLNYNGDFILYVKAYEEGNEDFHCTETSIPIDIELKNREAVIDSLKFLPSKAKCGETVNLLADVTNIGKKDIEDVYLTIKNPLLKINLITERFELEKFSSNVKSLDNEKSFNIPIKIPPNIKEGYYEIDTIVNFNSDFNTDNTNLFVSCDEAKQGKKSKKEKFIFLTLSDKPKEQLFTTNKLFPNLLDTSLLIINILFLIIIIYFIMIITRK